MMHESKIRELDIMMTMLPKRGVSFSFLYEKHASLAAVIAGLGFRPLSKRQEKYLRSKLGLAIGRWWQTKGSYQKDQRSLTNEELVASLQTLAASLRQSAVLLTASEEGLNQDQNIWVTTLIASVLSENPEIGSQESAFKFLTDFRGRVSTVVEAANIAAKLQADLKGKRGGIHYDWVHGFTQAVIWLCKLNVVPVTLSSDPDLYKSRSAFVDVAAALEGLLHPRMRAQSTAALAKRLRRSQKRRR
jgi:hypothetical protein